METSVRYSVTLFISWVSKKVARFKTIHLTKDTVEMNQLMVERFYHHVPGQRVQQWHRTMSCRSFWEQNDLVWSVQRAGVQRVQSHLEGHVPWSHTDFLFQFLGLSRGSFTLQTTLVQNIVEHLNQENRAVLTDRSQQRDTAEKARS